MNRQKKRAMGKGSQTQQHRDLPADEIFMPPELWGYGPPIPTVPVLAPGGFLKVSDRGPTAPKGQRYAVLGFDPVSTERYWASRPEGERDALTRNH